MHWIAPSEKDTATETLKKRLWRFLRKCSVEPVARPKRGKPFDFRPQAGRYTALRATRFPLGLGIFEPPTQGSRGASTLG